MAKNAALIVAAGRGSRFGGEIPKQYRNLGGIQVLRHSLEAFARHKEIAALAVVIHKDDEEFYRQASAGLETSCLILKPIPGGERRQDSVRLGLEGLQSFSPDTVLIHDGARPFVDAPTISRVLAALKTSPGALAAVPVTDTLKREKEGRQIDRTVARTVARAGLWRAQTPQGFHYDKILKAHRQAASGDELTDDAQVAEQAGLEVALVLGSEDNFKITTENDLVRGERFLMAGSETRIGSGFDVHAFTSGNKVTLCGIEIPHDKGLAGHSDADAGLHALTDALLGTIGESDIGHFFPPSDPKWKGAPSDIFLSHAAALVREKGGEIINADITLICEAPKIGPHREAMRGKIAKILGLAKERISIKATTTEKLGFTGRGEGIAAQAVVCVRLKT